MCNTCIKLTRTFVFSYISRVKISLTPVIQLKFGFMVRGTDNIYYILCLQENYRPNKISKFDL